MHGMNMSYERKYETSCLSISDSVVILGGLVIQKCIKIYLIVRI